MDINDLREELQRLAIAHDKRETVDPAVVVTACYEARRQLQRLTPQWHAMPTVAEARARGLREWLCKDGEGLRVVRLAVSDWGGYDHVVAVDRAGTIYPPSVLAEYWPCDSDGIREPSWPDATSAALMDELREMPTEKVAELEAMIAARKVTT